MTERERELARIKRSIELGTYYTEEKLRRAMWKVLADLPAPICDPWCGCDRCIAAE